MKLLRLLLCPIVLFTATALAEESYEMRLARPVKEGARFKIVARVAVQNETLTSIAGQPADEDKLDVACKLSGELTVLAVTGKGMAKELRLKIDEAESYEDGEKADLVSPGDVIVLKHGEDKDEVTVNGEEADEAVAA